MPMAYVIKTTTLFKSFWWRERGYNGFFANSTTCDESFPIKAGFDLTEHPGIVGFILANGGRYWGIKTKKERRDAVLAQFAKVFNVPIEFVQSQVIHYEEKNWSEQEFNRGAYMSFATPGTLTACGMALREPIQNIHFAGTETATEWAGYMDGAVQAGLRAANEIECALSDA
jgi:monoamine oxidase